MQNIARSEQEFPRLFANIEERAYGTLFYNEKIKDHHDSNHAILYPEKIDDLRTVLADVKQFYQSKDIVPALYHPINENYFVDNAAALKASGYEFTNCLDARVMVLRNAETKPLQNKLSIRRVDDEFLTEIYRNCIGKTNHFLFVGYFDGKPVTLVSFHVTGFGCTRFDEMKTAEAYANRGFAREMNKFAANFCVKNNLPPAYQWPAHGTSARITVEAGFEFSFTLPFGYASYAIEEHYKH